MGEVQKGTEALSEILHSDGKEGLVPQRIAQLRFPWLKNYDIVRQVLLIMGWNPPSVLRGVQALQQKTRTSELPKEPIVNLQ